MPLLEASGKRPDAESRVSGQVGPNLISFPFLARPVLAYPEPVLSLSKCPIEGMAESVIKRSRSYESDRLQLNP